MVNWNNVAENALYYWQEFIRWFLSIPLYGQVLVVIGIAAVLVLSVVIVYYVLKGVAYLVYYIIKGVYLLLKGIGLLFYKLFEAIYYAISGKPRPNKQESVQVEQKLVSTTQETNVEPIKEISIIKPNATYCSDCGAEFTERMHQQLIERGIAYCVHCGKGFKANMIEMQNY